ncbi:hybrid sensor histidine kinase/response regulator transcription factor [Roseimarinus sediminis]|uniref:hybrid sensor histidine kinase/response regulator transcription factor n=1 Tax=Roseimarinus sediminis TaxID=1610899 RepID=UPI003D1DA379
MFFNTIRYLVLIALLMPMAALAQDHYVFSRINHEQGLFDNRIRSINQLSDGRMVFITEGQVNFYDGVYFQSLHYNENQVYNLSAYSGFHHSYVDNENYLWLKNEHQLMLFDLQKERFVSNTKQILEDFGLTDSIADLFMDSNFDFWYVSTKNELIYRKSGSTRCELFIDDLTSNIEQNDQLYDLATVNQNLYLFYRSGIILCFDTTSRQQILSTHFPNSEHNNTYTYTLMVVPYKHYLYQIRNGSNGGIMHRYNTQNGNWDTIFKTHTWFNTLTIENEKNCWLSSAEGIWIINHETLKKEHLPNIKLIDGEVFKTEISTQYHDKNGGLWIGTFNRGLLYYHPNRFKFRNYGRSYFNTADDETLEITCFEENDGNILIGTRKGIYQYSKKTQQMALVHDLPSTLHCNVLFRDENRQLWLGTEDQGLFEIGDKIERYHYTEPILDFFQTYKDHLILCTSSGLVSFDIEHKTIESLNIDLPQTHSLIRYKPDSILGITYNRLFILDIEKMSVHFPHTNNSPKPAMFSHSNHKYNSLLKDSRGFIWFGTYDGLHVWETETGTLKSFYRSNGLVNNSIKSIYEDHLGRIWISTSNGISKISVKKEADAFSYNFENYNHFDGVLNNEFIPGSVFLTSDRHLLWGGIDGMNELNINDNQSNEEQLFTPLISRFFISGNEIEQGKKYDNKVILENSLAKTSRINLQYKQNFISFEFSALNYTNPARTHYRYMLNGIDEKWNEISPYTSSGKAVYTNLAPGDYQFTVYATNNIEKWDAPPAQLSITIHPPFWRTTLAYILYIVFFMASTLFISVIIIKQKSEKIKRLQKEELDLMKLSFYTNVSHDLKTPLSLIITPLSTIVKKIEDKDLKKQINQIRQNANDLLNQINQLIDFRKLEIKGETLQLSFCNMHTFLENIFNPFNELTTDKNISFTWNIDIEPSNFYIDKDKLKRIVINLLSNAFKYTRQDGTITVKVENNHINKGNIPAIEITIEDDGYGIPENEQAKIFSRFYQVKNNKMQNTGSGIGLHMVHEYTKLHKGEIELNSKIDQGSSFKVRIPINLEPDTETLIHNDASIQKSPLKILLVEDNSEFRTFLSKELSGTYQIIEAADGNEGYTKALEHLPDLILTDLMMPVMNGIELCHQLKSTIQVSHIPVIVLSAKTSDEAQLDSFEAKADAFVSKPFNMEILQLQIQNMIDKHELRKKLFKNAIVVNPQSLTSSSIDEKLIKKALDFISINMENASYSVEQLSSDMCMERSGLYRKIMALTGQNPTAFIRSIRLKRAAQLLEQGLPVSEVAEKVGFNTLSYFSKCFQNEFGKKPSDYR